MRLDYSILGDFLLSASSKGTVMVTHRNCGGEVGSSTDEQYSLPVTGVLDLIFGHTCSEGE